MVKPLLSHGTTKRSEAKVRSAVADDMGMVIGTLLGDDGQLHLTHF